MSTTTCTRAWRGAPPKLAYRFRSYSERRLPESPRVPRWLRGWSGHVVERVGSTEPTSWRHLTSIAVRGPVLVVDASCLFEVLTGTARAESIRQRLALDEDQAAPHVIDVEVFSVIRREHRLGRLDQTAAAQAVEDLETWPGERFGHRFLLRRAWELRESVRGWDAMYVALAEALDTVLLTMDARLGAAVGPSCPIEVLA